MFMSSIRYRININWPLVKDLTAASIKSRYRETFAGFLWVAFNPLLTYVVHAVVFSTFLKIQIQHFFLFLLSGLMPWMFISQTAMMTTPAFEENSQLLKSFKFNPIGLILSKILDNFINFVTVFLALFIFIIFFYKTSISLTGLMLLPLSLLPLLSGVLGLSFLLAIFQVFYKDTRHIVQFLTSIMFFLTPIFYPVTFIPEPYRWVAFYNPIYILIEPFRICLYNFSFTLFLASFGKALLLSLCLIGGALLKWRAKKNEFYLAI